MSTRGLRAIDITKDYSGVRVLMGVSLSLAPGEILGLVGHNGAGKSTLLKIFSGAHKHSGGHLIVDGKEVTFTSPAHALHHGVSTVYQELSLLGNLSVTQNVFLGREISSLRGLDKRRMSAQARDIIQEFGLDLDVDRKVSSYPMATRQLLEIAIAASRQTRYLLLDEPTTSLEGEQVSHLLSYVRNLATDKNIGVLIVNHKLDELYGVADRIVALTNGQVVIDAPAATVDRRQVVAAIAGHAYAQADHHATDPLSEAESRANASAPGGDGSGAESQTKAATSHTTIATSHAGSAEPGSENAQSRSGTHLRTITPTQRDTLEQAMAISHVTSPALNGVDLDIRAGEILGIYGLSGSGRSETLRAIAGLDKITGGEFRVFGQPYRPRTPRHAMRYGIAFVTEERKYDGVVPQMNSYQNTALPVLNQFTTNFYLHTRRMRNATSQRLNELGLRGDARQPIVSLSGGNQQKVLLARALMQNPRILLLDEPTKGVDIGVKGEIYHLLRRLAHQEGLAVVVVSSEEEEILEVSDSVCVFAGGKVIHGPVPTSTMTQATLRELSWTETPTPLASSTH
ncbi:sugar ABC transporter ATP-binding protein [Trueperella sp. LYQ143]|uniref:sugar ABC transporter ATP-binding protein n=1 Tax=unclassified Trueperella TaxID=2630174 RepID=UPI003983B575